MPAKWQRWMPFEIDAFRGSPSVQAMHPTARAGYLYLLADAWQTDDCTIGTDAIELADRSGLGDELWAIHGQRILRKFLPVEGTDRLRNAPLYERWLEAKRVHDARQNAAHRVNSSRSPQPKPAVTAQSPSRSVDTHTRTNTDTNTDTKTKTEEHKSKNPSSRAKRSKAEKVVDPRHSLFKEVLGAYWNSKNPGIEMPWDGSEAGALAKLLSASPNLTLETFRQMLHNRWKSDVNHSERPRIWLGNVVSYANGRVDRYGKPLDTNGGNHGARNNRLSTKESRNLEALAAVIAQDEDRSLTHSDGDEAERRMGTEESRSVRGRIIEAAD